MESIDKGKTDKEMPAKPEVLDKPDFATEALAYADVTDRRLTSAHAGLYKGAQWGMEKIFNEMVIPLREENRLLKEQLAGREPKE
jgi:hypothetical protein